MHGHNVVSTACKVADIWQELEECNRIALQAMSAEAERISGDLETWVEEFALKRCAPRGSRVLSKEDLQEWVAKMHKAEAAHDHACVMQVAAEAGTLSLCRALDESVAELDKLHLSGSAMFHGITGANRFVASTTTSLT